jgi:hypothetical protein
VLEATRSTSSDLPSSPVLTSSRCQGSIAFSLSRRPSASVQRHTTHRARPHVFSRLVFRIATCTYSDPVEAAGAGQTRIAQSISPSVLAQASVFTYRQGRGGGRPGCVEVSARLAGTSSSWGLPVSSSLTAELLSRAVRAGARAEWV